MREIGKNNLDLLGMDLGSVMNWFSASLSSNAGRYMKTSSLIVTYNDMLTTGGHNLSSRISRVNTMTNYKRSRGNHTPTDYEQPSSPEPAKPQATKPATGKPSGGTTPSTTRAQKPSTPKAAKPSTPQPRTGNTNVRSRSTVISSAPRTRRGL